MFVKPKALAALTSLALLACGTGDSKPMTDAGETSTTQVVHVSSTEAAVQSLTELASYVRGAGGWVIRASVTSVMDDAPVTIAVTSNLFVQYPMKIAELHVSDALGENSVPMPLDVIGRSGNPRVVDADGSILSGYVVSGLDIATTAYRTPPPNGEYIFFLMPTAGHPTLIWRAELIGASVSGSGTATGTDVTLESLRRIPISGTLDGPPPVSLRTLADEVRAAGGKTFIGSVTGMPQPLPPIRLELTGGLFAEVPQAEISVLIGDPLGETLSRQVVVAGTTGLPVITDAEGRVRPEYIYDIGSASTYAERSLPQAGTYCFFVSGSSDRVSLVWQAALKSDGAASGVGTQTLRDFSADELRR